MFLKKLGLTRTLFLFVVSMVGSSVVIASFILITWYTQSNGLLKKANKVVATTFELMELQESFGHIHSEIPHLFIEKDLDKLEGRITTLNQKQMGIQSQLSECDALCAKMTKSFESYSAALKTLVYDKVMLGKNAEAIEFYINTLGPLFTGLFTDSQGAVAEFKKSVEVEVASITKDRSMAINTSAVLTAVIVGLILFLGFKVSRQIIRHIITIANSLEQSYVSVMSTSEDISTAGRKMARASQSQAASVQETSSAMEEISSTIAKTADSVGETQKNSSMTMTRIEEGKLSIQQMLDSMQNINKMNESIAGELKQNETEMSEVIGLIKEIGEKTKVINDIVFQTKLLSFNASVEAARAGEAGKGFSVVAEEIGNLANMSGNSASEISEMLSKSSARVESIIAQSQGRIDQIISRGKDVIEDGSLKAQVCDESFSGISTDAIGIMETLRNISTSIGEQNLGIQEINKAMTLVDQETQSNLRVANDTEALSQELAAQSESLNDVIRELRSLVHGHGKAHKRVL